MLTIRNRFNWVWLLLISCFLISCSQGSTPPGASSIGGVVDGGSYSYHYWKDGLSVLLWQNASYGSGESCSGTGSTEDAMYRLECNVSGPEGRSYSWKVHTMDGVTGDMWIEDQRVDFAKGAMFLVAMEEDGVQVEQLQRDLSALEKSNEAISALASSDPDVASFIDGFDNENDSLESIDENALVAFTNALRDGGQFVEMRGQVTQPFFSVPGHVFGIDGEDVQVFEYAEPTAAAAAAAQISPDATSVGTSMVSWAATPHFYTRDRLIVLYTGEDPRLLDVLSATLGQPVAQGQQAPLPPPDAASRLRDAFAAADYEALQATMGDVFIIGYWLSEGQRLTPDQAIEQLRLNLLLNPASATFIRDRALFPDLGGVDPIAIFGPDAEIVDLVYSQGWGGEGLDEAILAIAQNADGNQYWYGILTGDLDFHPVDTAQEPASAESAVYRNSENGFALDYPAQWYLDEQVLGSRGSAAAFYQAETDEEPILSAVVYLWDPKHDLDAWLELRRRGWTDSGASLLSEEELIVADGHRAVRIGLGWSSGVKTNALFMEVGERYLEINGSGDLEIFDDIIRTLRFDAPGA